MIALFILLGLLLLFSPGILLGLLLVVTVLSFLLWGLVPTIAILLLLFLILFVVIPMITEFVVLIKRRYRRFKVRQKALASAITDKHLKNK